MLTENHVIEYLVIYLKENGYQIDKTATTNQKGVDIEAVKNGKRLFVEAKGATSSKEGSKRHGEQFSNSQVSTHIAMAVLVAMIKKNEYPDVDIALHFQRTMIIIT